MTVPSAPPARSALATCVGVIIAALFLVMWVGFGRVIVGWHGSIGMILSLTVAPIAFVLHGASALSMRTALRRGHSIRPAVIAFVLAVCSGVLFGATVPEFTDAGVRSFLAPGGETWAVEMTIALCNPLGIVYVGTSIATLVFSRLAVRGPRVDTEPFREPGVG